MDKDKISILGDIIIKNLCEIFDPEIPVNIYDLGLIYDVKVLFNVAVNIIPFFFNNL